MKIVKVLGMELLVGVLVGTSAFAQSQKVIDIQSVQNQIAQKHLNWRAKESWITRLSKVELKRMLGLKSSPQGTLDFESMGIFKHGLAEGVDWRNKDGVNWLGPVMNQGNCGSCVAFATIATLEAQASISAGVPWLHPTFSPQTLFSCGGASCATGWMPEDAASFLQSTGVPDEACMPYVSGSTGADVSCNQKCGDSDARSLKIAGYSTPSSYGGSVDAVKAALKNGPLVTTLEVYSDFITYSSGVYQHVTDDIVGGHAVSLVGFDDSKRAWLIRNSWGAEWGENGFAWISWDDSSGIGANTWKLEIPSSQGQISVTAPSDREYISGNYKLVVQSDQLKNQAALFHLRDSSGRDVTQVTCSVSTAQGCSALLDTTQLKEGRYEIYAESTSEPSLKSQVREFYMINSAPNQSLSFTAVDGVNLQAALDGRIEFNVNVTTSSVPMQHVEFRAIDPTGKIMAVKSNDYVFPQMKMGWRTQTVPNGKYKILFHGETTYKGKVYAVDSNSFDVTVTN